MVERADAARNREAILAAAMRLIREQGIDAVCMDDVAAAAGVGKGTVFRRFGDREGLVEALALQAGEGWRDFATGVLADGSTSAAERVVLLASSLFEHVVETLPLVRAFERVTSKRGCDSGFEPIRDGLVELMAQVDPGCDAEFRAEALLANLRAEHVHHLVERCGMPVERVRAGVIRLAEGLVAAPWDATMPKL
ncbi:helix-turn-helix domain-containing protein [Umezawaea sp.]|uniref:TetR/AcrR family transcriptional regulator n=1 Tax=Umezawaea sp. TaxID=1955258 RepID=UPI002ED5A337